VQHQSVKALLRNILKENLFAHGNPSVSTKQTLLAKAKLQLFKDYISAPSGLGAGCKSAEGRFAF
jgi:hypothetical protein